MNVANEHLSTAEAESVIALLATHLERYPAMGLADVYKLLHQAAFGVGHRITSKKETRAWLEHERGLLTPDAAQMLVENVHPQGDWVRVHLAPYLAYRHDVRPLLDAYMRSARDVTPEQTERMAAWWAFFERLCADDARHAERFSAREARLFGMVRAEENWPCVHHSPAYLQHHRPFYRVLAREEAEKLCAKIGAPFAPA